MCAAVTAAREGIEVILLQDRPVLGGNASSEVRLWALGASAHMRSNNRWARESGVIGEILGENVRRNREGNPHYFDALLLEKVHKEKNITLLLNTAVQSIDEGGKRIKTVTGYSSITETFHTVEAEIFCDASGDGIVSYLAGCEFRQGAEESAVFGEPYGDTAAELGPMMGHTIFFYSKDTGKPVDFTPPEWADLDVEAEIPRFRKISAKDSGCYFWWIEYGGDLDTIGDSEKIKWELWRIVYSIWNHIKNSGQFPEASAYTLEWVGGIPGKRESRRFIGEHTLTQQDVTERTARFDDVSFGGWSVDIHPSDGIYSSREGCYQFFSRGVYPIPFRCFFNTERENLLWAGRIFSTSHIAFASTRVMTTLAHAAQAAGAAAALCVNNRWSPAELTQPSRMKMLQQRLLLRNQFIPGTALCDEKNLAPSAALSASSEFPYSLPPQEDNPIHFKEDTALLLPLSPKMPHKLKFWAVAEREESLAVEIARSRSAGVFIPEETIAVTEITLPRGESKFAVEIPADPAEENEFVFIIFKAARGITLKSSPLRISAMQKLIRFGQQDTPEGSGFDRFPFWFPERYPEALLPAFERQTSPAAPVSEEDPAVHPFGADRVVSGIHRPYDRAHCWQPDPLDKFPSLTLKWEKEVKIRQIILFMDMDYEQAMETVQRGHAYPMMPQCVSDLTVTADGGIFLAERRDHYGEQLVITLPEPAVVRELSVNLKKIHGNGPGALFGVSVYPEIVLTDSPR